VFGAGGGTTVLDHRVIIDATRCWISAVVIGLDLCPFAKRVFEGGLIRYAVSEADESELLRTQLGDELKTLAASRIETIETTFLIHPWVLKRFEDYCDFIVEAERLVKVLGFRGVIQIANFHPEFQFANTERDDVENYTNRSPYPMLHLLREESVSKVAANPDELYRIPVRNVASLRRIGRDEVLKILSKETKNAIPEAGSSSSSRRGNTPDALS
jgi:hypothetical protein